MSSPEANHAKRDAPRHPRGVDTLVLSGGGVHGLRILGALERFAYYPNASRGVVLEGVRRILGTSVGYVIGLLLCAGYEPAEIMASVACSGLTRKLADSVDIAGAFTEDGVLSFAPVREYLVRMLLRKGFRGDVTLSSLQRASNVSLETSAYCLSAQKLRFFSVESDPGMACVDLARLACSVPVMFNPGNYEGKEYIDGAVLENFPICRVRSGDSAFGVRIVSDGNAEPPTALPWSRGTSMGRKIIHFFNLFTGIASQLQDEGPSGKRPFDSIVVKICTRPEETLQFAGIDRSECIRRFTQGFTECSLHLKKND